MIASNPNDRDAGRREGERRKDAAHGLFEAVRPKLIGRGRRALIGLLLTQDEATADDVRALIEVPAGIDPKCLGSVPGSLAKAGIIRRTGYRPSTRPEAHARTLTVWALADTRKAIQWLRDHPEPADAKHGGEAA